MQPDNIPDVRGFAFSVPLATRGQTAPIKGLVAGRLRGRRNKDGWRLWPEQSPNWCHPAGHAIADWDDPASECDVCDRTQLCPTKAKLAGYVSATARFVARPRRV